MELLVNFVIIVFDLLKSLLKNKKTKAPINIIIAIGKDISVNADKTKK